MSEEMKGLLESVAKEYFGPAGYTETLDSILTRRLLPLLEAGEAMRDCDPWEPGDILIAHKIWNTAWAAAKGEAGT